MPRLDGIEAARRILDERPIPIVMLTAYGQDELVSRAAEAGVFGYLVKPFHESDLLPAIRHRARPARRAVRAARGGRLARRRAAPRARSSSVPRGLLMEKERSLRAGRLRRLRQASQASSRPLKVVAEAVVATSPMATSSREACAA